MKSYSSNWHASLISKESATPNVQPGIIWKSIRNVVSFVAFGTEHSTVGFNSLIFTFDPAFPRLYRRTIAFVQSCLKRLRHIRTAIKVNDAINDQILTILEL